MEFKEVIPGERLRPYVRSYFIFESDPGFVLEDNTVFPGGYMEIVFNLGESLWRTDVGGVLNTTPPIELWGQLTQPLNMMSTGKNMMLGIRFFPHSAAYFFKEEVWEFNDQVADLRDVLGPPARTLHSRLLDEQGLSARIGLIESFLLNRLSLTERKSDRIAMVGRIAGDIKKNIFDSRWSGEQDPVESIASQYNISPRYLQKLFLQHVGVSPKLYSKINRFQLSLGQVAKKQSSLTSIAYDCGYFDQSHFIREFKSFTGITPSQFQRGAVAGILP